MRLAVDLTRFAWVLDEDPAEPCINCGCPVSGHRLHGHGVDTSNGRPSHGNAVMVAYCLTHDMEQCASYRSHWEITP